MATTAEKTVKIPKLPSWSRNGQFGYQLFKNGVGKFRIKPQWGNEAVRPAKPLSYDLTIEADEDGVCLGPTGYVGTRDTAAACVELAREYVLNPETV